MAQIRNDGPAGAPGGHISQQNLNQIVIEYLSKKGYTRTEAILRVESAAQNPETNSAASSKLMKPERHLTAYANFERWSEKVLDIYKPELERLLWPIFVYCYLKAINEDWVDLSDAPQRAESMFNRFKERFENEHINDLKTIQNVKLPAHTDDAFAKSFLENRYRFTLSTAAYAQVINHLESQSNESGAYIISILTDNLDLRTVDRVAADHNVIEKILGRSAMSSQWPAEDEGIPGHNPGHYAGAPSAIMTKLRLGPLPLEPNLIEDVMAELEEEDAKNPPSGERMSLVNEFRDRIKQEETDENPLSRTDLPLPASRARDVQVEVQKIKDFRSRFRIEQEKDKLSICMFTLHNTQDTVNCVTFSDDESLIAIGTAEHYIRIFTADGTPLPNVSGEQKAASEKLIGHAGPVYNLSFSPGSSADDDNKNFSSSTVPYTGPEWLLSCSADCTVRLWHLGLMKQIKVYKAHTGPVFDVQWGPFGHYFLTAGHDKKAHFWDSSRASPLRWFVGHDTAVDVCCFHPNGAYAFTASSDRTIRMFSCLNGSCVRLFTSHTGYPTALACSPTGKQLASADDHGVILLWDLASGKLVKRMKGHERGGVWSLSWNADGNMLLSGGEDGTVRLWDILKMDNIGISSKIVGEGGLGNPGAGAAGTAGTASAMTTTTQGKKKAKGLQVSTDQVSAFPTKQTPVLFVRFTRMNLGVAAGCYQGGT